MYNPTAMYIAEQFLAAEQNPWEVEGTVKEGLLSNAGAYAPATQINWVLDHPEVYGEALSIVRHHEPMDTRGFQSRNALEKFLQNHPESSLVFSQLHRFSPWLKKICDDVEIRTHLNTFATAFHTPPGEQAYDIHWDIGSVVALQVRGRKRWWVWPPVAKTIAEIYSQRKIMPGELSANPYLEVVLEPGDALFAPRGWPHYAVTEDDETSLHVSFAASHSDIGSYQLSGYPN